MKPLLTIKEAAAALGVSRDFVEREIGRRAIGHVRMGRSPRIPPEALDAYVKARTVNPSPLRRGAAS